MQELCSKAVLYNNCGGPHVLSRRIVELFIAKSQ